MEGIDLRGATHEKAVEVIKKTGNPVTFLVQSLVQWVSKLVWCVLDCEIFVVIMT